VEKLSLVQGSSCLRAGTDVHAANPAPEEKDLVGSAVCGICSVLQVVLAFKAVRVRKVKHMLRIDSCGFSKFIQCKIISTVLESVIF